MLFLIFGFHKIAGTHENLLCIFLIKASPVSSSAGMTQSKLNIFHQEWKIHHDEQRHQQARQRYSYCRALKILRVPGVQMKLDLKSSPRYKQKGFSPFASKKDPFPDPSKSSIMAPIFPNTPLLYSLCVDIANPISSMQMLFFMKSCACLPS